MRCQKARIPHCLAPDPTFPLFHIGSVEFVSHLKGDNALESIDTFPREGCAQTGLHTLTGNDQMDISGSIILCHVRFRDRFNPGTSQRRFTASLFCSHTRLLSDRESFHSGLIASLFGKVCTEGQLSPQGDSHSPTGSRVPLLGPYLFLSYAACFITDR
jgi:hypothetical protein